MDGRVATIGPVVWRHFYSNRNRDFVLGAVDDKHSMHVDDGRTATSHKWGMKNPSTFVFAWINQWT